MTDRPPLFALSLGGASSGSLPGTVTALRGKWGVSSGAPRSLTTLPGDLVDGWLEFGPSVREKPVTIRACGMAPGEGRLQSRFGAGLFGRNGFQLRVVLAHQTVELVRHDAVVASVSVDLSSDQWIHLELTAEAEDAEWIWSGRVWPDDGERPAEPVLVHRVVADTLLFPLAGRSVLTATPFSGEPVRFRSAEVFDIREDAADEGEEEENPEDQPEPGEEEEPEEQPEPVSPPEAG